MLENYSDELLAIIASEDIRTIKVVFCEDTRNEPTEYTYLSNKDDGLEVGDLVWVTNTNDFSTKVIAKQAEVVKVDNEADIDMKADYSYKFHSGKVDVQWVISTAKLKAKTQEIIAMRTCHARSVMRQEAKEFLENNLEPIAQQQVIK